MSRLLAEHEPQANASWLEPLKGHHTKGRRVLKALQSNKFSNYHALDQNRNTKQIFQGDA